MITVGSLIKSKRLSKNLSIEQISKELKIQKKILQNIENDKLEENINAVFVIGHLKSYSEYLELNTSEIIANFKIQISFKKNDLVESIKRPSVNTNMFNFIKFVPTTLILIIFTSFYFLFIYQDKIERNYALVPDIPENYIPIIEEANTNGFNKLSMLENEDNVFDNERINYSSVNASNNINEKISKDKITLKLLNPTWLQLRDKTDKVILSKLMNKDEEFTYDMQLEYNITAGNGGNIIVIINDKVIGKIGKYGEIIDSVILDNNFNN